MTDPVYHDYSSFGGGSAAELKPEAVLAAWKGLFPGFDRTYHQMGNLDIIVNGESAVVKFNCGYWGRMGLRKLLS